MYIREFLGQSRRGFAFVDDLGVRREEFFDYRAADHSHRVIRHRGRPYFVKAGDIPERGWRDRLAFLLAQGRFNVPEVLLLSEGEARDLRAAEAARRQAPGDPDAVHRHLVRLCQSYHPLFLPIRQLSRAIAAELVFSIWINRRDAHNSNRVFRGGVPMFFDFGIAFDPDGHEGEAHFFRPGPDAGFVDNWRLVPVASSRAIDTVALRALERERALAIHPVDDPGRFWKHVDRYRAVVETYPSERIRSAAAASGFARSTARHLAEWLIARRADVAPRLDRVREILARAASPEPSPEVVQR